MEPKPNYTPEQVQGELLRRAEPFRIQALRFVAMIGGILAGIGTLDLTGIASVLPEGAAGWLLTIGLFLGSAKQGLLIVGDLLDDWKLNKSFKFPTALILIALIPVCLLFAACGTGGNGLGLTVTPAGELLYDKEHQGNRYQVYVTLDEEGDVEKVRSLWRNADGVELEATVFLDPKRRVIRYRENTQSGWIVWSSKAGISLDGLPPEADVEPAS